MPPALRQTAARRAAALEIKSALPAGDGRHCAPPRRSATTAFAQSSTSFRHTAGPAGEICERAKASVSPNSTDGCCAAGAGPSGPAPTPAKRRRAGAGAPEAKPPENWEEVYRKIKDFRGDPANSAPVDVMGCERLGDLCAEPKVCAATLVLSFKRSGLPGVPSTAVRTASPRGRPVCRALDVAGCLQTKDAVTSEAVSRLRAAAQQRGRPFDAQFVHDMDAGDLDRCIGKVGFHNRKTTSVILGVAQPGAVADLRVNLTWLRSKTGCSATPRGTDPPHACLQTASRYLKKAAATCLQSHNGDIPGTLDGLTALAGVGPKMVRAGVWRVSLTLKIALASQRDHRSRAQAYLALQCAWGINEGVGVGMFSALVLCADGAGARGRSKKLDASSLRNRHARPPDMQPARMGGQ
ncbi:MAG: hypothetical protein BJ554DRAFT_5674 [Olpidium bornovanus]|uniref:HhH-GPD domain-containing protein n=1 Tax=Olpidium bornovanus TaxID=278681 RepID=A0A8H7ZYU4_9FUNG|nr:MAG: hypothetical protein BJ554DRAFT_5674 [Olpidium bornovanus]